MSNKVWTFEDYLADEATSYEKTSDEAFSALIKLVADVNRDEAIKLYVKATQASFWRGWYRRALFDHKENNDKASA